MSWKVGLLTSSSFSWLCSSFDVEVWENSKILYSADDIQAHQPWSGYCDSVSS